MLGTTSFRPRSKPQKWLAAFLIIPGIILFFCPSLTFGQCSTGNFGAASTFTTRPQPVIYSRAAPIAAGDFNSDGKVDLATASRTNTDAIVAILLGDGAGGFGTASESSLSSTQTVAKDPRAIVVGDFNQDGNLDLATANNQSKNISVLLGDGTGRFSTERINVIPIRGYPTSIAASDFNNDGKLDLVTTNPSSSVSIASVSVLFGDGTGNFSGSNGQPENIYPLSYDTPNSVTVGDFNGDAQQDFAVVGSHASTYPNVPTYVSIFMGDGRGSFAPVNEFRVVTNRDHTVRSVANHGIATADFNRDGKQDLVVGLSYMTFTYAGDGRGGFSLASMFQNALSYSLSVGDFNGDAKPDIVRTGQGDTGIVLVTLGDGAGGFGASVSFPVGESSSDMVVSDFNGDGKHDVAGSRSGANNIWVLLNTCTSAPLAKEHFLVAEQFSNRLIAFDSVTMAAGPFPVNSRYNLSADKRTRLILFARDLESTPAPFVTAQLVDYNNVVHQLTVESVRKVPFYDWLTQIVVKLPDGLAGGRDASISISVDGVESNKAVLSIRSALFTELDQ